MKAPVDLTQEHPLVHVDLTDLEPRHLAPCFGRVVSVLQILGSQDQSCQKHATTTHERTIGWAVHSLLHSEIALRHMWPDEDQVIESNLQCRVARARSSQRLLDVGTERQYAASIALAPARYD